MSVWRSLVFVAVPFVLAAVLVALLSVLVAQASVVRSQELRDQPSAGADVSADTPLASAAVV